MREVAGVVAVDVRHVEVVLEAGGHLGGADLRLEGNRQQTARGIQLANAGRPQTGQLHEADDGGVVDGDGA